MVRDVLVLERGVSLTRLGRKGQRQSGIDGFDPLNGEAPVWQATLQKNHLMEKLKRDLRSMDATWGGTPSEFVFVVAVRRSESIQRAVLRISEGRKASGKCPVRPVFWDELSAAILQNAALRDKYYHWVKLDSEPSESAKVLNYLYIDEKRVQMYVDQLPDALRGRSAHRHAQLEELRRYLRLTCDLDDARPVDMRKDARANFIEESMIARKAIIAQQHILNVQGLQSFAVWVSDPHSGALSKEFHGVQEATFVYLVESLWDGGPFSTTYTGCSALQALANQALGRSDILRCGSSTEQLGCGSCDHPVEKLSCHLGAVVSEPRRIRSLYRQRYITDEQCYVHEGQQYRVHDLLGYPLYIAEE